MGMRKNSLRVKDC
jgi:hypothetical protein